MYHINQIATSDNEFIRVMVSVSFLLLYWEVTKLLFKFGIQKPMSITKHT